MPKALRPRRIIQPIPIQPHSPEREYYRDILRYLRAYHALLNEHVVSAIPQLLEQARKEMPASLRQDSTSHMDAGNIDEEIARRLNTVQRALTEVFPDGLLRRWIRTMTERVNELSKGNVRFLFNRATDKQIEPLMSDKGLTPFFTNVVDQNVGLIRSILDQKIPLLKNGLVTAIMQDRHPLDIAKLITKHFQVTQSKARLIARDQTSKLNGALDQHRQTQIGVSHYIWRTMEDESVRANHKKLDGKMFAWDDPPPAGPNGEHHHPKQDFQCRCYAAPILDDLLDGV